MNDIGMIGALKKLTPLELKEINLLLIKEKSKYIVSGYAVFMSKHLVLFRGDGSCVVAPFDMFPPNTICSPNFDDLQIIDFGKSIKLGQYEVSSKSILEKLDPNISYIDTELVYH